MVTGYVLKADVRHYFPSVDHEILQGLLARKIRDRRLLELLRHIMEAYAMSDGKGMPLGALTSQLFANVYLNPLDHFVKEKLKVKFYIRYLDDFVIFSRSQDDLMKVKSDIEAFLAQKLRLQLHPEKTQIFSLHDGVGFLGFRIFYHYKLLRKSNIEHFLRRLGILLDEYGKNGTTKKQLENMTLGWLAHASWSNAHSLTKNIVELAESAEN